MFVILLGLVKILKHSFRLSLLVMDGLKVISPLLVLAASFVSFHLLVRDRLLCLSSVRRGLNLGNMSCILVYTFVAHACGFLLKCD